MTAKTPRPAKAAPATKAAKATASPKKTSTARSSARTTAAAGAAAKTKTVRKTAAAAPRTAAKKAPARTSARAKPPAAKAPAVKSPARAAAAKSAAVPKAPRQRTQPKPARETDVVARLRDVVVKALDDLKARDIVELDVTGRTSIADIIVVAGGTSSRHVKSIADEVIKQTKKAGLPPLGVEGQREGEWVLVDLGDIVVHIMLPRAREFYGLERLWSVDGDSRQEAAAV